MPDLLNPTNHAGQHNSGGTDSIADASTTTKGIVELATDNENAANVVVQGNDSRLSYIELARRRVGIIDDFLNADNTASGYGFTTTSTGSGAQVAQYTVNETGVFGVWQLETGTTATSFAVVATGSPSQSSVGHLFILGQGITTIEGKVKIPVLSDGTDTFKILFGFDVDFQLSSVNDGVYFEYFHTSSANWRICTANDGVRTETNSSTAVGTGWVRLKIIINADASSVEYFVNGTSIGTVTTNIPTATNDPLSVGLSMIKSVGITERTTLVDYIAFQIDLTTPR